MVTAETIMSRSPCCSGLHDLDVEADDLALLVLALERCVGGVGAHHVDLGRRRRRSGRHGSGGRCLFLLAAGGENEGGGSDAGQLQEAAGRQHGL
jgi:hypothetical protein